MKVLVLFAHPALEKSRAHAAMIRHTKRIPGITFHDLYQLYPDFDIDVKKEQTLLLQHEVIIWQHPFYWYSAPPLIKQWEDLVLEHGWAYGTGGTMLKGKRIFNAITCGGPRSVYAKEGRNRFTIPELLYPFDQTSHLCKMEYLPPFVVDGTHRLSKDDIEKYALQYKELLELLVNDKLTATDWSHVEFLNDLLPFPQPVQS
jgi:glutathione-regulated potassium-efflux system ancillary protein KefG